MTKVVLYIATSLDGYIARSDGGLDWLSMVDKTGEDYDYTPFYEAVDAIVSGSKTYELIREFGEWPYPGKTTFVLTQRNLKTDREDIEFVSDSVDTVLLKLKARGFKNVWLLGGGALVQSFIKQGITSSL